MSRLDTVHVYADIEHFGQPALIQNCIANKVGQAISSPSDMTKCGWQVRRRSRLILILPL